MLARADASVAGLGQQVSPARIIRTGIAVAYLDRLSQCREPLQRAIRHGREGGAITSAIEALFLLGQDAFHTGRWDEAQQLVDEGLRLCDTHGYHLLAWPGKLTAALLSAARGNPQTAIDIALDMDAWAAPRRAGIVGAYSAHIRGLTALGQDDFETAFRHAAAISPPGTFAPYAPHALWVFLDLVEAAIHTGRRTEAAAHVAAARDCRLDRLSPRLCLVVLAGEAITEPRTDTGPHIALEQAITEPGHDRWPFDLARIQLIYGSHLRRIKRTTDARRQLAAAAETFRRLGATPWAGRADRELRASGITVSTAGTGPASLTPQQRQIALLAAAGHTNKQIADRLFLSPERSPPTSTRSSPNSASPPAPPSATHSPRCLPNETARTIEPRATHAGNGACRHQSRPAWLPQPCTWNDMNAASMSYERPAGPAGVRLAGQAAELK